jgi:excisionase family DNA binding protein
MNDFVNSKNEIKKNDPKKIGDNFLIGANAINYKDILGKIEKETDTLWLSVSEAANLGGVQTKTIRRAIKSKTIKFKIVKNRYLLNCHSLLLFLHSNTKLRNKLNQIGIGRYVEKWAF